MTEGPPEPNGIGLALSGGGVRAAVFHLGVLRRLALGGALERVSTISSVSGGSLVVAMLFSLAGGRWPTSEEYLNDLYTKARNLLTTVDLFSYQAIGWDGLFRFNRRILTDRAGILADLLERRWGVTGRIGDLPDSPTWFINTACLDTGKNWRFTKREMGDWQFGKHYRPPFRIAEAAAASAAVPYVIGALTITLPDEGWFGEDPATKATGQKIRPLKKKLRLWDGGAYENLGLEAIFKPGQPLRGCDVLIVSDASGPLTGRIASPFNLVRGKLVSPRLFDIASDQIRALRARMFFREIGLKEIKGAYLRMGNSVRELDRKDKFSRERSGYDRFMSDEEVAAAASQATDLKALPTQLFDRIARHGFEMADTTLPRHLGDYFAQAFVWPG